MSNWIKFALLLSLTVSGISVFAKNGNNSGPTEEQLLLTPGKLDAAEFDMLKDSINNHIKCLDKVEDFVGGTEEDSHGLIHAIGQMVWTEKQNLAEAIKEDSLEKMRATEADLVDFIKNDLEKSLTQGIPECSI